jgi:hypothetical protein
MRSAEKAESSVLLAIDGLDQFTGLSAFSVLS